MKWLWDYGQTVFAIFTTIAFSLFSEEVRSIIKQNQMASALALCAILLLALTFWLWRHGVILKRNDFLPLSDDELDSKIEVIFADKNTSRDIDEIYDKFFPQSGAMDDNEYDIIQERKKFVRAAQKSYQRKVAKKISGYYSVFPMSEQTFESLKSGSLKESDLTSSLVLDPDDASANVLYVCEICSIDPETSYHMIIDMKKYLKKLMRSNGNIIKIGAWGFSESGRRLIRIFGLKNAGGFDSKKPFFEISTKDALRRLN